MDYRVANIWLMADWKSMEPHLEYLSREHVLCSFIISPYDSHQVRDIMRYLYLVKSDKPFLLTIDAGRTVEQETNKDDWYDMISMLLAHPCYYRNRHRLVIWILGNSHSGDPEKGIRNELQQVLTKQGFETALVELAGDNMNVPAPVQSREMFFVNNRMLGSLDEFYHFYIPRLIQSEVPLSLVVHNGLSEVRRLITLKNSAEDKLFREESHLAQLIKAIHIKSSQVDNVALEKSLIEEELVSKKKYLDFVLKKATDYGDSGEIEFSDLIKLKRFYQNEYEILPLWYKRFGHLIKVIMGKRTFASLFSDKVKKYKE